MNYLHSTQLSFCSFVDPSIFAHNVVQINRPLIYFSKCANRYAYSTCECLWVYNTMYNVASLPYLLDMSFIFTLETQMNII